MLGPRIAIGRTSEVFEYGNDAVAKVLASHVPERWAAVEAHITQSVRSLGVPAPDVLDVITIDGRSVVVFERIVGPSMWQQMILDPSAVDSLVSDLAAVQRSIHSAGVPSSLPSLVDRMSAKIGEVGSLSSAERDEAIQIAQSMPRGAALLHGDLHPGNVLLGPDGPIVIDWFDASVGHPAADVVRSSLLLSASGATDLRHLPDAPDGLLGTMHASYLREMHHVIDSASLPWRSWEAITAVSRLAERTDADPAGLHAIWAARPAQHDA